jgi:hypothetical protein
MNKSLGYTLFALGIFLIAIGIFLSTYTIVVFVEKQIGVLKKTLP